MTLVREPEELLETVEAPAEPSLTPEREPPVPFGEFARPLLAATLASVAAGLVVGGIFGSWAARLIAVLAAAIGAGWCVVVLRSRNRLLAQAAFLPVLMIAAVIAVVASSGGTISGLPTLLREAIDGGRSFRPPVPFDPGWRFLIVAIVGMLSFAASMVAVVMERARLGVALPVPLIALAAISQPDGSAFVAALSAFVPMLGAIALLYGDNEGAGLGRDFELKRAVRGVVGLAVIVVLLFGVSKAGFLFPEPVYDPDDQPQKPRPIPLSKTRDRVLFEVTTDSDLTGPWRIGALDVYREDAFQSVPSLSRLEALPDDGSLASLRADESFLTVDITVRDLGDSAAMPVLAGSTRIATTPAIELRTDPRYEIVRVPSGRVPAGTSYTLTLPPYPTNAELAKAPPGARATLAEQLEAPEPPSVVQDLLAAAPDDPWRKLDALRQTLLERVVASGPGTPAEVSVSRVARILKPVAKGDDGNEATPFEIVATEGLLARWAGIPSRIGFGYDGLNKEKELLTVRPRNAAQWLETYFEGFGWVPLIGQPDKAKTSLANDPENDAPKTIASSDVVAQVFIVYERRDIVLLYQRVRHAVFLAAPWVGAALVLAVVWPGFAKMLRSRNRRRWAEGLGPRAQIAVEYAEFRDRAIDLNVGDDYDSPLEYLGKIEPDAEHEELAWLVARTVYGDLEGSVTDNDALAAEELSHSMRRRISRAQPATVRALAFISRASIELPFSSELPNLRTFKARSLILLGARR